MQSALNNLEGWRRRGGPMRSLAYNTSVMLGAAPFKSASFRLCSVLRSPFVFIVPAGSDCARLTQRVWPTDDRNANYRPGRAPTYYTRTPSRHTRAPTRHTQARSQNTRAPSTTYRRPLHYIPGPLQSIPYNIPRPLHNIPGNPFPGVFPPLVKVR